MKSNSIKLCAVVFSTAIAAQAAAQDITLRWALHPGAEADAVVDYFAPRYEEETGIKVIGEILPANQLRDQMSIEAIGDTDRWDITVRAGSALSLRMSLTSRRSLKSMASTSVPTRTWSSTAT